jgi:protein SCO1
MMKETYKTTIKIILAILWLFAFEQVRADHTPPDVFDEVAFIQKIGAQTPYDLVFLNESGSEVRFANFLGGKPVILVLAYYECPMLCSLVLNDLVDGLQGVDFLPGEHFEVVVISIDTEETPAMAAATKENYLQAYGRPETEPGWHFLTGESEAIQQISESIGFQYLYDPETGQYAHPAGVTVLTPEGQVSAYIFGVGYTSSDLRLSLVEASQRRIGTVVDQFVLLCYQYDPETGGYGLVIQNVLRLGGLATVMVIGSLITVWLVRERRLDKAAGQGGGFNG